MGPGSPRVPVVHVAAVCAIFGRVGQLSRRSVQCTTRQLDPLRGGSLVPFLDALLHACMAWINEYTVIE